MATPGDKVHIQEMYDLYVAAEKTILNGQAYSVGDRTLTRADLRWVTEQREKWGLKLEQTTANESRTPRAWRVIPRDGL